MLENIRCVYASELSRGKFIGFDKFVNRTDR